MYGAQEVRQAYGGTNREGLSEAMPPIEALKLVISQAVTANNTGVINRKLLFMDVSKAYLHADVIDQELYVVLPKKIELVDCHASNGDVSSTLARVTTHAYLIACAVTRGAVSTSERPKVNRSSIAPCFHPCLTRQKRPFRVNRISLDTAIHEQMATQNFFTTGTTF